MQKKVPQIFFSNKKVYSQATLKKALEINDFKMGKSQDFANILIVLNSCLSPIEKVDHSSVSIFSKTKIQIHASIPFTHFVRSFHSGMY